MVEIVRSGYWPWDYSMVIIVSIVSIEMQRVWVLEIGITTMRRNNMKRLFSYFLGIPLLHVRTINRSIVWCVGTQIFSFVDCFFHLCSHTPVKSQPLVCNFLMITRLYCYWIEKKAKKYNSLTKFTISFKLMTT